MKKIELMAIAAALILGGGVGFFGGMQYGRSNGPAARPNFQAMSGEQRQQYFQQMRGGERRGGMGGRFGGGDFMSGEILSKDNTSLTIKLSDGGSKIIFLSASTTVSKVATATLNDLEAGKSVTVNGSANSDGSLTAQMIQLRPAPEATAARGQTQ